MLLVSTKTLIGSVGVVSFVFFGDVVVVVVGAVC